MTDSHEELLMHRALEYQALDDDWSELNGLARTDPSVWRRLADGLRDEGALRRRLDRELSRVDQVELPAVVPGRRSRLVLVSGWAAAFLLAALWLLNGFKREPQQLLPGGPGRSDLGTEVVNHSPSKRGTSNVVDELPAMMIETVPAEDGSGYDVLFLRRTIERIRVNGVFQLARDEYGLPAPALTSWSPESTTERM